jgi:hypothetical protein
MHMPSLPRSSISANTTRRECKIQMQTKREPRKQEAATIQTVSWDELAHQMNQEFVDEFEQLFVIGNTGSIQCRNTDVPKFKLFYAKWNFMFWQYQIRLPKGEPPLQLQGWGETSVMHDNKKWLERFYGFAFLVYCGACRFVGRSTDPKYGDMMLINLVGPQ